MPISTVSSKGQITLPVEVRKGLGIKPHDRIMISLLDGKAEVRRIPSLLELKGFLGKAATADEEQESIGLAAAEHALGIDE